MRFTIFALFAILLAAPAFGQALAPEVAPLAAKYEADVKALDAARAEVEAGVRQKYVTDLNAAERSATANGRVAEVAAIIKTREEITAGKSELSPAPGSPPSLQKRHSEYLSSLSAADREISTRYERTGSEFLRSLASIEARAPAASPIHDQIAALKLKLSAGPAPANDLVGVWLITKNDWKGTRTLNADHTFADENGHPTGTWTTGAGKLLLQYGPGKIERFQLPPNRGQMNGTADDGRALVATKVK